MNSSNNSDEEPTRSKSTRATIVNSSCVPKYNTFRVRGVIQGRLAMVLIDGGSTHNFIDASLIARRNLATKEFNGFDIKVARGRRMDCLRKVYQMELKMFFMV